MIGGTLVFKTDEPASRQGSIVTVTYDGFTITAKGDDMSYILPVDKKVKVKVSYVDSAGNPATVDGPVTWDSANPDIAEVTVDTADSSMASVVPGDTLGQTQITATADADLGAGVTTLITTMDVEVVAGQAVAGVIEPVGEAVPI